MAWGRVSGRWHPQRRRHDELIESMLVREGLPQD
jgi:hypothetical protein